MLTMIQSLILSVLVLLAASDKACCSWNACGQCGDTTDYCNAGQYNCERDCGGQWCPDGAGGGGGGAGYNTPSVCSSSSGDDLAYACMDWNVGSAAMLNAANSAGMGSSHFFGVGSFGSDSSNMGKCYEVGLSGAAKRGIFQVVNEGGDVNHGNFDLQMGNGGFGIFNGCVDPTTAGARGMFNGSAAQWGNQYGGWRHKSECSSLPAKPRDLRSLPRGEPNLQRLCELGFEYGVRLEGGGNPAITTISRVACPAALVAMTGLDRSDRVGSEAHSGGTLTRMMDCCKPSAGWIGNAPYASAAHPAVIPCTSDGYTRIKV